MYPRIIADKITQSLEKYPMVSLIGPRQSGKTTLAKMVAPHFAYYNLEDPSFRHRLIADPNSFFSSLQENAIIDEVQQWPDLFSYLQVFTDRADFPYRFILTGSNSLQLSNRLAQSLAGRTRIFQILPLAFNEIPPELRPKNLNQVLYQGGYPRIYHRELSPTEWLGDYLQTYVQKDVRQIIKIENLMLFDKFLRLLAGRVGQLLNLTSLASEAGLAVNTVKSWIGVLEASFIVYQLWPHFKNFNKRITKSCKLYFHDTGLLCYLLRIFAPEHLESHPLRGHIFENWVVAEKIRRQWNDGLATSYYFWRDQHGHEVDLVQDCGTYLKLTEIKSSATFHPDFIKNIQWLNQLQGTEGGEVIYGGAESFAFLGHQVTSWPEI